jgi:hypothetical protein
MSNAFNKTESNMINFDKILGKERNNKNVKLKTHQNYQNFQNYYT